MGNKASYVPVSDDGNSMGEEETKALQEEIRKAKKSVTIICGGPTGSGKSSLLNSVLGIPVFKVGESLSRGTLTVQMESGERNGIVITVWDTPGLERNDKVDNEYLRQIMDKSINFDLFLYCVKANDDKATELLGENSALFKFTKAFGSDLWKNAVIALTFSNYVESELKGLKRRKNSSIDIEKAFEEKMEDWKTHIREALNNAGVPSKIVQEIPIQPTGNSEKGSSVHLPGHEYWLSELFNQIFFRSKAKAKVALAIVNSDRYTDKDLGDKAEKEGADQPIRVTKQLKVVLGVILGLGGTGAIVGAGVGATIGALAIGIPTFGVAAGVGLVIGGLAGAAVVGGGTVAVSGAIAFLRRNFLKKEVT